MLTRIISGGVLALLAIGTGLLGGPVLMLTILFCAIVGMREYDLAVGLVEKGKPYPAPAIAGFVGAVCYYLYIFLSHSALFAGKLGSHQEIVGAFGAAALVILVILATYVITFPKYHSEQAFEAVFSFVYVAVMLSFMYLTREGYKGNVTFWLIYLSSWGSDTAAYFTGRFLGKHKMAPVLSPKKTVEGAVGGVVGAGIFGLLFSLVFDHGASNFQFFIICAVGAVISVFGDLTASAIKRDKGIKDYGNLIPGHGGILDRFDSVIFTAPVIYFLSVLLVK